MLRNSLVLLALLGQASAADPLVCIQEYAEYKKYDSCLARLAPISDVNSQRFSHLVTCGNNLVDGNCYKDGSKSIRTRCTETANEKVFLDFSDTDDCSTVTETVELAVDRNCQSQAGVPDGNGGTATLAYKATPVPGNPHCLYSYQEFLSLDDCSAGKSIAAGAASLTLPGLVGKGNSDGKKDSNCQKDEANS